MPHRSSLKGRILCLSLAVLLLVSALPFLHSFAGKAAQVFAEEVADELAPYRATPLNRSFKLPGKAPKWEEGEKEALREQMKKTLPALASEFSEGEGNQIFSPLAAYRQLSVAAELSRGDLQKDLLAFLGASSPEKLRSAVKKNLIEERRAAIRKNTGRHFISERSLWLNANTPEEAEALKETLQKCAENTYTNSYALPFSAGAAHFSVSAWLRSLRPDGGFYFASQPTAAGQASLFSVPLYRNAQCLQCAPHHVERGTFTRANGQTAEVDFLFLDESEAEVSETENFLRVSLPLGEDRLTLIQAKDGVQPEGDDPLARLLSRPKDLEEALFGGSMETRAVHLEIPLFELNDQPVLNETYKKLGFDGLFKADEKNFSQPSLSFFDFSQELSLKLTPFGLNVMEESGAFRPALEKASDEDHESPGAVAESSVKESSSEVSTAADETATKSLSGQKEDESSGAGETLASEGQRQREDFPEEAPQFRFDRPFMLLLDGPEGLLYFAIVRDPSVVLPPVTLLKQQPVYNVPGPAVPVPGAPAPTIPQGHAPDETTPFGRPYSLPVGVTVATQKSG
ncbi:MAG: hypothetical protein MSC43_02140 [Clostridiales bacterium]|nr:hypothetical protein [Clostridiales bacterium]MDD7432100.1 serpin family protein [Clostridiales bacterium]MDY3061085.1 serpin family protein [Eubacteriales bacterium]